MTRKMTPEIAQSLSAEEQHYWFRSRTASRRALLRGGLVGPGTLAVGSTLIGAGTADAAPTTTVGSASLLATASRPSGALVVPFGRHLAYGSDPTREMSVSWQVPALVKRPFVRIGTSPWDLGNK